MKDITKLKNELEVKFAKKFCNVDNILNCPSGQKCTCKIAAEIRAYMLSAIPEAYIDLTLKNFDGRTAENKEKVLDNKTVIDAKETLIKYCWDAITLEDSNFLSDEELDQKSIIDKRREDGTNVVIYAGSENTEFSGSTSKKPRGKTLVASLILKEAIKRRAFPSHNIATYDWVDYRLLCKTLMDKEEKDTSDARSADWLVIDDIVQNQSSQKMKAYLTSVFDPFLAERIEDKLPTILVFRFDITRPGVILEDQFGVMVDKIVNDSKTFRISLSEKE